MVEYLEKDLLGSWSIAVLVKGVILGHIRRHGNDGSFVYYKGQHNQLNWSIQDPDISALQRKIEATLR